MPFTTLTVARAALGDGKITLQEKNSTTGVKIGMGLFWA